MPEAQVRPARCTGGRGNEAGHPHLQPLLLDPRALTFRDTAPYRGHRLGTLTIQGEWEEDEVPHSAGCPL